MACHTIATSTTASPEEILTAAVHYFASERFTTTSRTSRNVTFAGRPEFPRGMIAIVALGYVCFIVPGIILQFTLVRKLSKPHSLVVTVSPAPPHTAVHINYPGWLSCQVRQFIVGLPHIGSPHSSPLLLPVCE